MRKCEKCNGTGRTDTRSNAQNRALHKWFAEKARQCNDHGVTMQEVYNNTIELEVTPENIKDMYKRVLKALYNKNSTTKLSKTDDELNNVLDHVNRFFAEKIPQHLDPIALPSRCYHCQMIDCMCE